MSISILAHIEAGMNIKILFYGARDILLLCSLVILPKLNLDLRRSDLIFIQLVILLALINIFDNMFQLGISEAVFRRADYFTKKGTDSNFGFGIVGERIYYPFYSPNLLSTFFSLVAFALLLKQLSKFKYTLALTFVNIFTVSKVFIFYVFISLIKRMRLNVSLVLALVFFALLMSENLVYLIYNQVENPLVKYHLASVIGHLKAFNVFSWQNMSLIPEPLGSNSIIAQYINNQEKTFGIESTILVRLSELRLNLLIFILYICFASLKFGKIWQVFNFSFLLLLFLTATSNHPVVFGSAALIILSNGKGRAHRE